MGNLNKLLPGQVFCNYGLPGTDEEITNWLVQGCLKFCEASDQLEEVHQAANNVIPNIVAATAILDYIPYYVTDGFFTVWTLLWSTEQNAQAVLTHYLDEWIDNCCRRLA